MHFDTQAKEWDNDPKKTERAIIFAKEIKDSINPKPTWNALEFGSGTGLLSYQLKDSFNSITLADNSQGMIKVLHEKIETEGIKNFKPLLIDLLEDSLNIGTFQVLYTLMTLHHILDLDRVISLFKSLLKSDGYLCIADLVQEDGSFHFAHPDFKGHNGFDKEELSALLLKNGFKVEHYKICFEIEKEVDDAIKKYPLFLLIAKKTTS
jgi:ubiquinone/menaquinone biosynthesis C-methylase UbiE